ncbi:MAG TPA: hypothetical protein VFW28_01890 [Micropepsaceae bacterium]|nr:hypothetical protein [Micropepsaceae bacterium]
MCGELEEEAGPDEQVYDRYVAHVNAFLAGLKGRKADDPVYAHLDRLFRELLSATIDPHRAPGEMTGSQRVAMEPLVFARLAGFIAAHSPLSEDPLRRLIEALMLGYSEGEIAAPQDHDHGHDHFHDHGHHHHH